MLEAFPASQCLLWPLSEPLCHSGLVNGELAEPTRILFICRVNKGLRPLIHAAHSEPELLLLVSIIIGSRNATPTDSIYFFGNMYNVRRGEVSSPVALPPVIPDLIGNLKARHPPVIPNLIWNLTRAIARRPWPGCHHVAYARFLLPQE
jgi:hypothetical protein